MRTATAIVVAPNGSHLSDMGSGMTWCGLSSWRWPTFALNAGSDFGKSKKDCAKCAAERKAKP